MATSSSSSRRRSSGGNHFAAGDLVEVSIDEEGFRDSWYAARVLCRHNRASRKLVVEFDAIFAHGSSSRRLSESVEVSQIRPLPPVAPPSAPAFRLHQVVDAAYNDGWWTGGRRRGNGGRRELQRLLPMDSGGVEVLGGGAARSPRLDRRRVDPSRRRESCRYRLRCGINCRGRALRGRYPLRMVFGNHCRSNTKRLSNCRVIQPENANGDLLEEVVDLHFMRPTPPRSSEFGEYGVLDKVEAFYARGWWPGVITSIHGAMYTVETIQWATPKKFNRAELRDAYSWDGDEWIRAAAQDADVKESAAQNQIIEFYPPMKQNKWEAIMDKLQQTDVALDEGVGRTPSVTKKRFNPSTLMIKGSDSCLVKKPSMESSSTAIELSKESDGTITIWGERTDIQSRIYDTSRFFRTINWELLDCVWCPKVGLQQKKQMQSIDSMNIEVVMPIASSFSNLFTLMILTVYQKENCLFMMNH